MDKTKALFIKTTDEETKNKLIKEGFQLVSSDSSGWTFLNDAKMVFDKNGMKVIHTNSLNL